MISLAYYLRVVAAMWMRPGDEAGRRTRRSPAPPPRPTRSTPRPAAASTWSAPALLAAAGAVFFGVIPQPLVEFAEHAGASLF